MRVEPEKLNTPLAREAELVRLARDGDQTTENVTVTLKVKGEHAISVAGQTHGLGATFSAPQEAVRDALARGLVNRVQKVEKEAKR